VLFDQKIAEKALKLAGVKNAMLGSNLICYDPDEKPNYHNCHNAIIWVDDNRTGLITLGYRVSEMIDGKQKPLPFGGRVSYSFKDGNKTRKLWKDSPLEEMYSRFRFSQYGTG